MNKYEEIGISQNILAILLKKDKATISRLFAKHNLKAISEANKQKRFTPNNCRVICANYIKKTSPQVLSFYNFKGGTGKTSICFQVAAHLALLGFEVLVIDSDPQGHLTTTLGISQYQEGPTLFDVIAGTCNIQDAVKPIFSGLSCIPSNLALTRLEVTLNQLPKREEQIEKHIKKIAKKYDYIIFDTNPNISLLNRNILVASDSVNIICETQPYSLNGLKLLMEDMKFFYKNMSMKLPEVLVIPNKYEDRSSNSAEAMTILRRFYEPHMIPDFAIRKSEDIVMSSKNGLPLAFFARKNSIAFEDISDLCHFIVKKKLETNNMEAA
ncbi:MAG: AAA family ATPase [Alphaproteobacteria bacterium]|nr:AAA family ATPase [Alphaproteobacteria bacterium]